MKEKIITHEKINKGISLWSQRYKVSFINGGTGVLVEKEIFTTENKPYWLSFYHYVWPSLSAEAASVKANEVFSKYQSIN